MVPGLGEGGHRGRGPPHPGIKDEGDGERQKRKKILSGYGVLVVLMRGI